MTQNVFVVWSSNFYQRNEAHGILTRSLTVKMVRSGRGEAISETYLAKDYGLPMDTPDRKLGPYEGILLIGYNND